ncbi:MAG: DUF5000 domain-containing lipoprotein [Marinifilaceae bacterium]
MRYLKFISFFILWAVVACEDAPIGQTAIDNIAPQAVSNPKVINLAGGAKISYTLPDDEDLLYVKGVFQYNNGAWAEVRASVYTDTLKIEGIGDTLTHQIKLIAVDRSGNESTPCYVDVKPKTPPYVAIFNSLSLSSDFGGVKLSWENPTEANIAVTVQQEIDGEFVNIETIYRNSKDIKYTVRGLKSQETKFAVFIRDRWDNFSDTLYSTLTPLFEMKIPYKMISPYTMANDEPAGWGWIVDYLWDNAYYEGRGYHTDVSGTWPQQFTFKFKEPIKMSRFKVFQRLTSSDWVYGHGNPKEFEVYGCNESPSADMSNWNLISKYSSYKPSGLPLGSYTNEDYQYQVNGEDFAVDSDIPAYMYIRFVVTKSWDGGERFHIMELPFWGCPVNYDPEDDYYTED